MSRVGIVTLGDGRGFVHKAVAGLAADAELRIAAACEVFGAEVVRDSQVITANDVAVPEARQLVCDDDRNEALLRQSNYVWPHAFTRMGAPADTILSRFGANHVHAVLGDMAEELAEGCRFLDVDLQRLDARPKGGDR